MSAQGRLVSPEIHSDGTVTFRLDAKNASSVKVNGLRGWDSLAMTQNDRGIWSVTVGPMAADLYSYTFSVDGATVTDPLNRNIKKWLMCNSQLEVPGNPPRLHEQADIPHGSVHLHYFHSTTTGTQRSFRVYTPPGYNPRAWKKYPVVFLLHGYGDDSGGWTEVGRAHWITDGLIARGEIEPLIIVNPDGHPVPIPVSEGFEDYSPRNLEAVQSEILNDLLPFMESNYRVKKSAKHRALVGLSMGGGQSLGIGLSQLDQFEWVGGFSSACPRGEFSEIFPALVGDEKYREKLRLLWIGCGRDDFLLERNKEFIRQLEEANITHDWLLTDGGHSWSVWRDYWEQFLKRVFVE